MIKRFVFAVVLLFAGTQTAFAQTESVDFCDLSPNEMLAALDGTWSFTQGPGFVLNAAMPLPLPGHPPKQLTLEYFAAGYSKLSGQGQEMLMVGGDKEDLHELEEALTEQEAEGLVRKTGKGCSWDNVPIMVGSTNFSLDSKTKEEEDISKKFGIPLLLLDIYLGNSGEVYMELCKKHDGSLRLRKNLNEWGVGGCETLARKVEAGDMIMSMILKFESPFSGTGILMFKGQSGKHSFFAKAPLTFSR